MSPTQSEGRFTKCRATRHNTQSSVLRHFHDNDQWVFRPITPPHSWGSGKGNEQCVKAKLSCTCATLPPFCWNKCSYINQVSSHIISVKPNFENLGFQAKILKMDTTLAYITLAYTTLVYTTLAYTTVAYTALVYSLYHTVPLWLIPHWLILLHSCLGKPNLKCYALHAIVIEENQTIKNRSPSVDPSY
jgi:hypothetical protein